MKRRSINKDHYGYIFIAPFIIVFIAFVMYPIANTFRLSFTDWQIMSALPGNFIGIDNFIQLFNSPMFFLALRNTWTLWFFTFIPQVAFALILAAMFTSSTFKLKGGGFFKAMYYLPNLFMPATVAALFNTYLSIFGPLNQFLVGMGFMEAPRHFLQFPMDARIVIIFLGWWMWFGQTAIVLSAGMTSISPTYYESAMVDGASQRRMFLGITLPLLRPILLFVLVTSLTGGLQAFDIPFLITNGRGDPQGSIMTLNIFMNLRRASAMGDVGAAAAISVVLFIMSSASAAVLFRVFRDRSDDNPKIRKGRYS